MSAKINTRVFRPIGWLYLIAIVFCSDPTEQTNSGYIIVHREVGKVLTLQISNMNHAPIFILGRVIGIIPYAQLCPTPSPLVLIFTKNRFINTRFCKAHSYSYRQLSSGYKSCKFDAFTNRFNYFGSLKNEFFEGLFF